MQPTDPEPHVQPAEAGAGLRPLPEPSSPVSSNLADAPGEYRITIPRNPEIWAMERRAFHRFWWRYTGWLGIAFFFALPLLSLFFFLQEDKPNPHPIIEVIIPVFKWATLSMAIVWPVWLVSCY